MLESVTTFLTSIKNNSPKFNMALLIGSSLILFSGEEFLKRIGFYEIKEKYQLYMGLVFIFSMSVLLMNIVYFLKDKAIGIINTIKQNKYWTIQLKRLTNEEKGYLLPYIEEKKNTQYFDISDGISGGLASKKIIYRASNLSSGGTCFAYNLQTWARLLLEKNNIYFKDAVKKDKQSDMLL